VSDELTSDLRELAAAGETPPPVPGTEIRLRAVRRRRRRRTAVTLAGACAAASLALVVALNLGDGGTEDRPSPAASPTASPTAPPSTPAAPDVTVDLGRRVLTVAGRELPVSVGTARTPTATGRMTVVSKFDVIGLSAAEAGLKEDYVQKVPWVIRFRARASGGATNFLAALTYNEKAPGNLDVTSGWIGLRPTDAKWLYEQVDPGAVIEIVAAGAATPRAFQPSPAGTDSTGPLAGAVDSGAAPSSGQPDATAVPVR
jgi:hypothetical protein